VPHEEAGGPLECRWRQLDRAGLAGVARRTCPGIRDNLDSWPGGLLLHRLLLTRGCDPSQPAGLSRNPDSRRPVTTSTLTAEPAGSHARCMHGQCTVGSVGVVCTRIHRASTTGTRRRSPRGAASPQESRHSRSRWSGGEEGRSGRRGQEPPGASGLAP
jgi:hypothetical protein